MRASERARLQDHDSAEQRRRQRGNASAAAAADRAPGYSDDSDERPNQKDEASDRLDAADAALLTEAADEAAAEPTGSGPAGNLRRNCGDRRYDSDSDVGEPGGPGPWPGPE